MNSFNFGKNLRNFREGKNICQEAVAYALNISQPTYSRLEKQEAIPDIGVVNKIAETLGCTPSELLPLLEELDHNTMVSTRGSGLGTKAAALLHTQAAFIIKIGLAFALANVAYDFASGACSALRTSANTELFACWIAALVMTACFYYWVSGLEKWLNKKDGTQSI